ncbi:MAG: hypothetical protein ACPICH_07270, partial [Poseidonia sp.]
AKRQEALSQKAAARQELRAMQEKLAARAQEETHRAVRVALVAHEKKNARVVATQAVHSITAKTDEEKKELEASTAVHVQKAIQQAELRHKKQQAEAVAKAVNEATEIRKAAEEKTTMQRVSAYSSSA